MRRSAVLRGAFCFAMLCMTLGASAQLSPERHHVRAGNRAYGKGDWVESEQRYRKAIERAPDTYEAWFNLGDALYKQERMQEAAEIFGRLGADSLADPGRRAQDYYNLGNALFRQKQYEQAAEAYRQSLRLNPDDREAKFNLAYTLEMLRNQQNDQNNQNDQQDRQQDQQQGGENEQKRKPENGEQGGDSREPRQENDELREPQPDRDDPQQGDGEGRTSSGMNREEAERMLDAIQQQENKTRDKVNEQKVMGTARSGKNW